MNEAVQETVEAVEDAVDDWVDDPEIAIERAGDEILAQEDDLVDQLVLLVSLTIIEIRKAE
jgi:hypothetical protein